MDNQIYDFVFDDFMEQCYYDRPEKITLDDVSRYWIEYLHDCQEMGRDIPEGITVELYITIWNELVKAEEK